ncbi:MAG: hypothetical protein GY859_02925 [Desulfobacterales bacterium]|nr:hypothetical protein [Desulfobacterales bacterium]
MASLPAFLQVVLIVFLIFVIYLALGMGKKKGRKGARGGRRKRGRRSVIRKVRPGKRRIFVPGPGDAASDGILLKIEEIEELFEKNEISREERDSLMNAALEERRKKRMMK